MRLSIICYLLLIGAVLCAGNRFRKGKKTKRVAIYRSLGETDEDKEAPITTETEAASVKRPNNNASEGRLLKHFLLFQSLMKSNQKDNNGLVPYVIVNSPAKLTNINSNIVTNGPNTPTTDTATTTGGTTDTGGTDTGGTGGTGGTGTGGTGAGGDGDGGQRISPPVRLAIPTQIYHQRNQPLPQVIYGPPLESFRRGNRNRRRKTKNSRNPFSAFANRLRKLQFA